MFAEVEIIKLLKISHVRILFLVSLLFVAGSIPTQFLKIYYLNILVHVHRITI